MVRSLIVLLCFLVSLGETAVAQTNPEFVPPPEIVGQPENSGDRGFDTELEFTAGAQTLGSGDISDTYGVLPFGGVGVSWQLSDRARLVLAVRYCQSDGDPDYDTPEFQSDQSSRLTSVPAILTVRENLAPGRRMRFLAGISLQMAWIEETLPAGTDPEGQDTKSGFGTGLLLTLGPEWRTKDERRAIGVEFGLGGCGADLGPGRGSHEVDLTGIHARAYVTMRLGGDSDTEVQP